MNENVCINNLDVIGRYIMGEVMIRICIIKGCIQSLVMIFIQSVCLHSQQSQQFSPRPLCFWYQLTWADMFTHISKRQFWPDTIRLLSVMTHKHNDWICLSLFFPCERTKNYFYCFPLTMLKKQFRDRNNMFQKHWKNRQINTETPVGVSWRQLWKYSSALCRLTFIDSVDKHVALLTHAGNNIKNKFQAEDS